jgi:hypothetical protein
MSPMPAARMPATAAIKAPAMVMSSAKPTHIMRLVLVRLSLVNRGWRRIAAGRRRGCQ